MPNPEQAISRYNSSVQARNQLASQYQKRIDEKSSIVSQRQQELQEIQQGIQSSRREGGYNRPIAQQYENASNAYQKEAGELQAINAQANQELEQADKTVNDYYKIAQKEIQASETARVEQEQRDSKLERPIGGGRKQAAYVPKGAGYSGFIYNPKLPFSSQASYEGGYFEYQPPPYTPASSYGYTSTQGDYVQYKISPQVTNIDFKVNQIELKEKNNELSKTINEDIHSSLRNSASPNFIYNPITQKNSPLDQTKQAIRSVFFAGAEIDRGIYESGYNISKIYAQNEPFTEMNKQYLVLLGKALGNENAAQELISGKTVLFPSKDIAIEQTAKAGGTIASISPYLMGEGQIRSSKYAIDILSGFNESPEKGITNIAIGGAFSILAGEVSLVNRLNKGLLGGTIAGSYSGLAQDYYYLQKYGAPVIETALTAPLAYDILSSYAYDNSLNYEKTFLETQGSLANITLGANIGNKVSRGFVLFKDSEKPIISGGITSPGETIARQREISNVFDAKEPGIPPEGSSERVLAIYEGRNKVFKLKEFYEAQGSSKELFNEQYNLIYKKLKGVEIPVKELDVTIFEALTSADKASVVVSEYLKKNTEGFALFGSGVQPAQTYGVGTGRQIGDIDSLQLNPPEYLRGLQKELRKEGYTTGVIEKNKKTPLNKKGQVKSDIDFLLVKEGEHYSLQRKVKGEQMEFINMTRPEDNAVFQRLQTYGDFPLEKVYVKTPSGINLLNLRSQAKLKIEGAYINVREKDFIDLETIRKGTKQFLDKVPKNKGLNEDLSKTISDIEKLPKKKISKETKLEINPIKDYDYKKNGYREYKSTTYRENAYKPTSNAYKENAYKPTSNAYKGSPYKPATNIYKGNFYTPQRGSSYNPSGYPTYPTKPPATPYKPPGYSNYKPITPPGKTSPYKLNLYKQTLSPTNEKTNNKEEVNIENKKQKPSFGYDVFVKKNVGGKRGFVEVDKKATSLSQRDAITYGENVTDASIERSFVIRKSSKPVAELKNLSPKDEKFRFSRTKTGRLVPVFVEKSRFGLDTPTEVQQIQAAKLRASFQKNIFKAQKTRGYT